MDRLKTIAKQRRPKRCLPFLLLFFAFYLFVGFYLALRVQEVESDLSAPWQRRSSPPRASEKFKFQAPERSDRRSLPIAILNPTFQVETLNGNATFSNSFGRHTFLDFARRVLSRKISSSNVLVIAPDAVAAARASAHFLEKNRSSSPLPLSVAAVDYQRPYSLGGNFLLHAAREGHDFHGINFGETQDGKQVEWNWTLDGWWSSFGNHQLRKVHKSWSSTEVKPRWIIAAVVDCIYPHNLSLVDRVWQGADRFLDESTLTYLVVAMHSRKLGTEYEYGGLSAAGALFRRRYKVQLLLISHYFPDVGDTTSTESTYFPNMLFKSVDQIESLLRWGADAMESCNDNCSTIFTAYLFATQGLDLAIPSREVFLKRPSAAKSDKRSHDQMEIHEPLLFKSCPQVNMIPREFQVFFSKVKEKSVITVTLPDEPRGKNQKGKALSAGSRNCTYTSKNDIELCRFGNDTVELWVDQGDFEFAEAACARFGSHSRCVTRVVERNEFKSIDVESSERAPNVLLILLDPISRPHFKRSMKKSAAALDSLNFIHFEHYTAVGPNSGKNQAALYSGRVLADRDGIREDAGKNLWIWDRLRSEGYATLKAEDGCIENSNMIQSIHPNTTHGSALTGLFCFDFDRPNCIGPDLASQLLLDYGEDFMETYERRKTGIGIQTKWAAFLHFIDTHEDAMTLSSLLDDHLSIFIKRLEEKGILNNTLVIFTSDHGLHYGPYFQSRSGRREATEPLLYMHMPPFLRTKSNMQSLNSNAALWTSPFDVHETLLSLCIRPENLLGERRGMALFKPLPEKRRECSGASDIPQTYCNLHMIPISGSKMSCQRMPSPPSLASFFSDIPPNQRSISKQHNSDTLEIGAVLVMNVSKTENHVNYQGTTSLKTDIDIPSLRNSFGQRCECATNNRQWYTCNEHPWVVSRDVQSNFTVGEYFALVKCGAHNVSVDLKINAHMNREIHKHFGPSIAGQQNDASPNILVVQVDGASRALADRSFPHTRALLRRHRLKAERNSAVACEAGICAADFPLFSLLSLQSYSNKVASLSGCLVSESTRECFDTINFPEDECSGKGLFFNPNHGCEACPDEMILFDPLRPCISNNPIDCCTKKFIGYNRTRICKNMSRPEFGMQLLGREQRGFATYCPIEFKTSNAIKRFLPEILKSRGYLSISGIEHSIDESIGHVSVFPSFTSDISFDQVFSKLQEWSPGGYSIEQHFSAGPSSNPQSEMTGAFFNATLQVWREKNLLNTSKFAYFNKALQPDERSTGLKVIESYERYDKQLAELLRSIMYDERFDNTVIVICGGHGYNGPFGRVEYSVEVELRNPWTQLVIPSRMMRSSSLRPLLLNQDRLVTALDLYQTLSKLIDGSPSRQPRTQHRSYNLLRDTIPRNRTCLEARVSLAFCVCDDQVIDRPLL